MHILLGHPFFLSSSSKVLLSVLHVNDVPVLMIGVTNAQQQFDFCLE